MAPNKNDVYEGVINDLKDVYEDDALSGKTSLKKKIADAGEFIDTMQLVETGKRECKVGSTIPE
jgi:hypothetical protein